MRSISRWTLFGVMLTAAPAARAQAPKAAVPARPAAPRATARPALLTGPAAIIQAAGDALGMLRFVSRDDAFGSMEFLGTGTTTAAGYAEYYGSLSYVDNAMRVVMTPIPAPAGRADVTTVAATAPPAQAKTKPMPYIEVVNGTVAWNESELGAGLVAGQGVVTPVASAAKERMLLLWTLPYGIVKAAAAAGDKAASARTATGYTLTFPFSGELAGVTATVTLDAKNLIRKVATASSDPALVTETTYSLYKEFDNDGVTTNILFPGRLVRTQGGKTVFDIRTSKTNTNNPYEVFPIPVSVRVSR